MRFQINPTPQQGGTQTIQQSIYLTHNNPCGQNLYINTILDNLNLSYRDMQNLLTDAMATEASAQTFENVRRTATEFLQYGGDDALKNYLYSLNLYGIAVFESLPSIEIPPNVDADINIYMFDSNGGHIYSSEQNNEFGAVQKNPDDSLYFYSIPTLEQYHANYPTTIPLYFISSNSKYLALIDYNSANAIATPAIFFNNQMYLPEAIEAVSSLLIDTANTRSFSANGWGFSTRLSYGSSTSFGSDSFSYNTAYVNTIYAINTKHIIETFIIRLNITINP